MKRANRLCIVLMAIFTAGGCEREMSKSSEPHKGVVITNVSAPATCVQGDMVPIIVTVENRGDQTETFELVVIDTTEDKEIARKSVTLSGIDTGGMDDIADLILTGEPKANQYFGDFLAVGDVNGDGFADLLVSAAQAGTEDAGKAYLYYGGKNVDNAPDKVFAGENPGDRFSGGGGCLADMNNDGFDDVIIGAVHFANRGRVYLFMGGPDMDEKADLVFEPEEGATNCWFGRGMTVGDVNGDGYMDLMVSAPDLNNDTGTGRVYLFFGGNPFDTIIDRVFSGEGTGDEFGRVRSARGDVDGDGCDDLLIGTRSWPGGRLRGRAYLYYGATEKDMDAVCDVTFDAESEEDEFAADVDLFDIDNDGHADVLISARKWPPGRFQGRVYLYWGGDRSTFDNVPDLIFTGEADAFAALGGDHVRAGYANDDEYGDILVTAYDYYQQSAHGRTYVFYGNTKSRIDSRYDWTFTGDQPGCWIMDAGASDFNGDKCGDIAIGGWGYPNWTKQGRVWLHYGRHPSSTDVAFHWDTANMRPGDHVFNVKLRLVAGSGNVAGNGQTLTVSVKASAPSRTVEFRKEGLRKSPATRTVSRSTHAPPAEKPTTSFTVAAVDGNMLQVKSHLACGTDINEKTISGDMALHYAIKYRHREVAELLIASGADIYGRNRDGETPAHLAIKANQKEVLDLLLAKGATVSPAHLAAYKGHLATVSKSINEKMTVNTADEGGLTLLHAAASGGQKDVVAYLINHNADLNARDKKKQTPLFCAAASGHREVAGLLLAKGADPNPARDPDHWTPLYAAVDAGYRDVVELLADSGGNVNARAITDDTPLHVATLKNDKRMAELLIRKGAGLNARNARDGNTPLHLAVVAGYKGIVELLSAQRPDLDVRNTDGFTPLHYAASTRRLSFWESRIGESSTPNDLAITELLITHGADVNMKSNDGATPLSLASRGGKVEIVQLLKKHGAKE